MSVIICKNWIYYMDIILYTWMLFLLQVYIVLPHMTYKMFCRNITFECVCKKCNVYIFSLLLWIISEKLSDWNLQLLIWVCAWQLFVEKHNRSSPTFQCSDNSFFFDNMLVRSPSLGIMSMTIDKKILFLYYHVDIVSSVCGSTYEE